MPYSVDHVYRTPLLRPQIRNDVNVIYTDSRFAKTFDTMVTVTKTTQNWSQNQNNEVNSVLSER